MAVNGNIVAEEARYHRKSSSLFNKPVSVDVVDTALLQTFEVFEIDRAKIWSIVEIMGVYEQKGGHNLSRRKLLEKVESHLVRVLCVFTHLEWPQLLYLRIACQMH